MDFLDKIVDHIETNLGLYSPIRIGILGPQNSIAIRPTPGSLPDGYLNGDRIRGFSFQILTQHENPHTAYTTLEEITRSEEHTSELQSRPHLVCRLLLEKK